MALGEATVRSAPPPPTIRRFHPLVSSFCYPKPLPPKHRVTPHCSPCISSPSSFHRSLARSLCIARLYFGCLLNLGFPAPFSYPLSLVPTSDTFVGRHFLPSGREIYPRCLDKLWTIFSTVSITFKAVLSSRFRY